MSVLIGDPLESMFSELVSVEFGVELKDLVNGSVEWRTRHHSGKDVMNRLYVRLGQPIVVEGECRVAIEHRLPDFLLTVTIIFSVSASVFGHSNPPIKASNNGQ